MRLVVFGLTVSSSWGNGHATLWRGLLRALHGLGHTCTFFERDVPYYAAHRDTVELPYADLRLYSDWRQVQGPVRRALEEADVAVVTSYCPDGPAAAALVLDSPVAVRVFYDLDTPVTLERLRAGEAVPYLPEQGLADFDLVLSYTGGPALRELTSRLGARRVAPLYGSVDPEIHGPTDGVDRFRAGLSYLGTYAADRQAALERLFVETARRLPAERFVVGGAQYPASFPWTPNIFFVRHVPPQEHAAFYCSSRATLNVTRRDMANMGYCPSGRLFEAAACGVPVISDLWPGLEDFFAPEREILPARDTRDVVAALALPSTELARIGGAARERTLAEHSASRRAAELVGYIEMLPGLAA